LAAGARNVYLVEQTIAAALGAGIDLSKPCGNLIVDIGGGSTDIAVLSLGGIVCKSSVRTGGCDFDSAIMKYIRHNHNILIGEKTAESIKIQIGGLSLNSENLMAYIKGRDLLSGLPKKIPIYRHDLLDIMTGVAGDVFRALQSVLEKTPPELAGDIRQNGIILTGGGSLLDGMAEFLENLTGLRTTLAENPTECVALGTAKSFSNLEMLMEGIVRADPSRQNI